MLEAQLQCQLYCLTGAPSFLMQGTQPLIAKSSHAIGNVWGAKR